MSTETGYLYKACGLNVHVANISPIEDDGDTKVHVIPNLPGLHYAIVRAIIYSKGAGISGPEMRFLRTELGLTPGQMAGKLDCSEAELRDWERKEQPIPVDVDRDLRLEVIAEHSDRGLTPKGDDLRLGRDMSRVSLAFDKKSQNYSPISRKAA